MKKPRPAKKKQGAPAYMAQYSALMTILLAFFVLMLTLGQDKTSGYKSGVGAIRNTIGLMGGSGTLEFWRSMRNPGTPPEPVEHSENEDSNLIGYTEETLGRFLFPSEDIQQVEFMEHRRILLLRSSIRFKPGRIAVRRDTRFALDHAFALLYTLRAYQITVGVIANKEGDLGENRLLAARRAAWLAQHISEQVPIPGKNIRSLGIARNGLENEKETSAQVVFLLRKIEPEQDNEETTNGN